MAQFSPADQDSSSQRSRPRSRTRIWRIPLILMCAALIATAFALRIGGSTPTARADTTLVWSDEFNGAANTGLNTNDWKYDIGTGYGTGEIEQTTNSTANVSEDGQGHLNITALRDGNGNWTSGRIETQRADFGAPAGGSFEMSASIQQPNLSGSAALGYWPAFWSLGAPYRQLNNWPTSGEIDMMEDVNGLSSVWGTLHCDTPTGGACGEPNGISSQQRACNGCQTGFHTYSVIVDRSVSPEQIRWYLDGNNYFTLNANQVGATAWANAVDHAFFIIFDLAIGGAFPNGVAGTGTPTSATASGGQLKVDWVRVYQTTNGTTSTPTATSAPPTATPTQSGGCSGDFTQGANSTGANTALFWFKPCNFTAGYVILHETPSGQAQQNVGMSYNSGAGRWEYTVGGLNSGQNVSYSFTYQKGGLQYDTGGYNYTQSGGGSTPTPTPIPPTPTPSCTGTFQQGASSTGSNTALFWFKPCNWTAGYVIIHETPAGQTQQNVGMTYNSGQQRWEYTVGGLSSGQNVTYSFTYQQNGLQYDTGNYNFTHP